MKRQIKFADEAEFELNRGAAIAGRAAAFENWKRVHAQDGDTAEAKFYLALVQRYDVLLAKFDAILIADTSQDAEPEEDEDEEEED